MRFAFSQFTIDNSKIHLPQKNKTMNRREALSSVALLLGGTIIGAEAFFRVAKPKQMPLPPIFRRRYCFPG
jgi:hypothetical protein